MENFLGEIRMFAGNFAPANWHLCDGSILQISQNESLFTLLGDQYGGDGRSTFGLPDLCGRAPVHIGSGAGLTPVELGQMAGSETVTLTSSNLPPHTHTLNAVNVLATDVRPGMTMMLSTTKDSAYVTNVITPPATDLPSPAFMNPMSIGITGISSPTPIMQPSMPVNFIIALLGIYPPRN